MPNKTRNRKRYKLRKGVVHSFKAESSSSLRTAYAKCVIDQSVFRSVVTDASNREGLKRVRPVDETEKIKFNKIKFKHPGKKIFFSAKSDSKDDVKLEGDGVWVNVNNNESISLIDTTHGMQCFDKYTNDIVFVLLNRQDSIQCHNPAQFLKALEHVEAKKPPNYSCRGIKREVVYEDGQDTTNYVTVGVAPNRGGKGLYKKSFVDEAHQYTIDKMTAYIEQKCSPFINKKVMKAWRSVLDAVGLEVGNVGPLQKRKSEPEGELEDGEMCEDSKRITSNAEPKNKVTKCRLFPSMATGRNTCLQMHTDEDAFLSVVCIYQHEDIEVSRIKKRKDGTKLWMDKTTSNIKMNCDVLKYFTFSSGVSVGLRTGDILMFNPQIEHCISSNTDVCKDSDVFCTSHYFKSSILGLNDNSQAFHMDTSN